MNLLRPLEAILSPGFLVMCISDRHFNVPFPLPCRTRVFFPLCQSFAGRTRSQLFFILESPIPFPGSFGVSADANSALAAPLGGRERIPSFTGSHTGRATGAPGASQRIHSSFSGMHFDGEKVAGFAKPSGWSGRHLDLRSALFDRPNNYFSRPWPTKWKDFSYQKKKPESVTGKFAVRSNLVLICINLSFSNLPLEVVDFWWEVLIFYNFEILWVFLLVLKHQLEIPWI